jgi:hypothetical protein
MMMSVEFNDQTMGVHLLFDIACTQTWHRHAGDGANPLFLGAAGSDSPPAAVL